MTSTLRRLAAVTVVAVALPLAATTLPAGAAAGEQVLKTKTLHTKPSGTATRLQLVAKGDVVTLTLAVKKKGKYVVVAKKKLAKRLPEGVTDLRFTASQAGNYYEAEGGQGLVSWVGPADGSADDYSNYFGWNIKKRTVELF